MRNYSIKLFMWQVGEQDVAFGAKFSARIVMEVEEVLEERLAEGTREIEFRQLEGDFQKFEGVWRMEQVSICDCTESIDKQRAISHRLSKPGKPLFFSVRSRALLSETRHAQSLNDNVVMMGRI